MKTIVWTNGMIEETRDDLRMMAVEIVHPWISPDNRDYLIENHLIIDKDGWYIVDGIKAFREIKED